MGLDFSQIAIMLSDLFEKGLVVEAEEKGIILTEKGREILEELSHTLFSNNNSKWILPADKFRIEKIGISDVYLPRKKS
jgi:ribosomal protein S19E (S16A)